MPNPVVTHSTIVTVPDNSAYPVGSNEWNASHIVTGLENVSNVDTTNPANIVFTPSGTGAVVRSVAAKLQDTVNVKDFGAKGDGTTDDSAAFTAALTSGARTVYASGSFVVHDVTIPGGINLVAYGGYFVDKAGAAYIFKLTGYGTKLLGAYVSSATNCSVGAIVVDDGQYQVVRDVDIVNTTSGIWMQSSSNGGNGFGNTKAFITHVTINNFSGIGYYSGPNVHDANIVAVYCDANTVAGGGGQIPKAGTTGFAFVGTGSTVAAGGNQAVNTVAINCQTGYQFTDANLDNLINPIADSCSGIGFNLTGSTNNMVIGNAFVGYCAAGVVGNGTGNANQINSLRTNHIGEIPSWGGTSYYSSAGFSAPFYDLQQIGTGSMCIDLDAWGATGANAHSFAEAVAGNIQMNGGVILPFHSGTTVPAATTVFIGQNGQSATQGNVIWDAPQQAAFYVANAARVVVHTDTAPGVGNTFTYTLMINGVASTITGSMTGTGIFAATMSGAPASVGPNKSITMQAVTSASAAAARHRGYIQLIPQPN